jgi:hypothetical protein
MNWPMQRSLIAMRLAALVVFGSLRPADAHVGPPFPILTDQRIPGYVVTIWADPDIGEALFYVVLEPGGSKNPKAVAQVHLSVEPVNGRLPKKVYLAAREKARGHLRYMAMPQFDTQEFWKVGAEIRFADGTTHSLFAQVESTPPGLGPWDLVIYLFPFVLFGGLWAVVFVRRSRAKGRKERGVPAHSPAKSGDSNSTPHPQQTQ